MRDNSIGIIVINCLITDDKFIFRIFKKCYPLAYLPSGSDNEDDFGLSFDKDVSFGSCLSSGVNVSLSGSLVLLEVLL